jgi:hypothetical protein
MHSLAGLLLLTATAPIAAEDGGPRPLLKVSWKERHEQQKFLSGEFVAGENGRPDALKLVHREASPQQFSLIEIEPPAINTPTYVVRGNVRYEGVEGTGYLEMWNHFSTGGPYFTKTLAEAGGPLGVIRGSSDWREFALPFNKGSEPSPTRLVINLVLPGRGSVEISDLELHAPADELFGASGGWWPEQTAALMGAIGGSVLGVFLGCVIAPLIAVGRARHFVYIALGAIGGCGLIALIAGLSALAVGQPYHVYYPALLLGGLSTFFGAGGFVMALARYRQHDLRRMSALDVG